MVPNVEHWLVFGYTNISYRYTIGNKTVRLHGEQHLLTVARQDTYAISPFYIFHALYIPLRMAHP